MDNSNSKLIVTVLSQTGAPTFEVDGDQTMHQLRRTVARRFGMQVQSDGRGGHFALPHSFSAVLRPAPVSVPAPVDRHEPTFLVQRGHFRVV